MHRGDRTWDDVTNGGNKDEQWVRKLIGPMLAFDPQRENETYQREIKKVLGKDW
jgi:hypothetical protein